ncbi:MAG: hypothetical protein ACO3RV_07800, partial [Luteolibacter sp.]
MNDCHDTTGSDKLEPAKRRLSGRRRILSLDDYEQGILSRDTAILSRAITLVESRRPEHEALAQQFLERVMPRA